MTIYSEHCIDYLKRGYSVIPAKGKRPLIKGWADYCSRQPTQDEVSEWCQKFPEANIDVALGEQSGVIALDFDETNPELIKIIEPLLPDSPVERIGSKGFVRFFRYSGEVSQNVYIKDPETGKKRIVLEVLSQGKKVTIAPSIHPDTMKPYIWSKKGLLDVDIKDLPKFPPMLVAHLQSKLQILETTSYETTDKITEGRNMSLSSFLAKELKNPHMINEMIEKLIDFDKVNHVSPLFSDLTESEFDSPNLNATIFYLNHLKSINIKRKRENKDLELPIYSSELDVLSRLVKNKDKATLLKLPEPTGAIKLIYDHILDSSYIEQPVFAMSAALSLVGVLCSRKVTFQSTTPNLYLLNIGESGSGKDSCQQVIKDLLFKVKAGHKLLGATSYPSEAAIIKDIDIAPVRLDIIDEASTFLSAATKGGSSYAQGIGDTLCELFSCSNSYYLGKSLASSNVNVGAVSRPHINLLCSTTPRGINESVSITSLEKGLFARFLVFFGDNDQKGKRLLRKPKAPEELLDFMTYWFKFTNPNIKAGNFSDYNAPAYKIPLTRTANDLLTTYHQEFDNMRVKLKGDNVNKPIVSRLYQQMLKIVLLSAVSNTKVDELPVVRPLDVEYGYAMVNYFFEHIKGFVKDNLYESQREQRLNKVLNTIKSGGDEGITNAELADKTKFLQIRDRLDIVKDLKEAGRIFMKADDEDNSTSFRFFYIGG